LRFFKLLNLFPALKDINWCLIFGITPSQVLNFFQNLPSLKIGAYRLVLIKQNACTAAWAGQEANGRPKQLYGTNHG